MPERMQRLYVRHDDAVDFAVRMLMACDVPDRDAETVATCLVRADLRGVRTHGLVRLPAYIERISCGLVNPRPNLVTENTSLATGILDGQNGLGCVVASRAMAEAMNRASTFGIGMVGVRRSTHFGMAANYALQAVEAGFIAMVFSNASPSMPPWGARTALLGTSPLAVGTPGRPDIPIILDMSTAVAARGKIRLAAMNGESIPPGYALDADGIPTRDAGRALNGGVVLPIGGPKGSGLALFMDILCGVLTGAAFAGGVGDQYVDYDRPQNVGHVLLAVRPDLYMKMNSYHMRIMQLVEAVKACRPAPEFDEVLLPGEKEFRAERESRFRGIDYLPAHLARLQKTAGRLGVEQLATSAVPLGFETGNSLADP